MKTKTDYENTSLVISDELITLMLNSDIWWRKNDDTLRHP